VSKSEHEHFYVTDMSTQLLQGRRREDNVSAYF